MIALLLATALVQEAAPKIDFALELSGAEGAMLLKLSGKAALPDGTELTVRIVPLEERIADESTLSFKSVPGAEAPLRRAAVSKGTFEVVQRMRRIGRHRIEIGAGETVVAEERWIGDRRKMIGSVAKEAEDLRKLLEELRGLAVKAKDGGRRWIAESDRLCQKLRLMEELPTGQLKAAVASAYRTAFDLHQRLTLRPPTGAVEESESELETPAGIPVAQFQSTVDRDLKVLGREAALLLALHLEEISRDANPERVRPLLRAVDNALKNAGLDPVELAGFDAALSAGRERLVTFGEECRRLVARFRA